MDQWNRTPFEIAFNDWNFELIEIFVRFYKTRQRDLNPSFFRDMAKSRPNSGQIDEGFFDILTNLIRQNEFEECHCKGICKIQELCELMVSYDLENDQNSDDTDSSSDWETESESSKDSIISEEYEKACREKPLLRNRLYLIVLCALKK